MQEGVEEIDAQKAQVCQPLQKAFHTGISDLRYFAGVECFTEANINVVLVKASIRPIQKAET